MAVYSQDRAVEELEDISTQQQISGQLIWAFGPSETKAGIVTRFQWKEYENWFVPGEDVNPEATPIEGLFLDIRAVEPTLYETPGSPQQGTAVMYYNLSNVVYSLKSTPSTGFTLATYPSPLPLSRTRVYVGQPTCLLSSLEQRIERIWLLSERWSLFVNWITIYSREETPEAARLATIRTTLSQLSVPYNVDKGVLPLLNESTLRAVNIVTGILNDEILRGLPVKHVGIEPLIDRDAGQWSEVVFIVQVDLSSTEANRAWDNILDRVSEVADKQEDKEVTNSLLEKIGIHFAWVIADSV